MLKKIFDAYNLSDQKNLLLLIVWNWLFCVGGGFIILFIVRSDLFTKSPVEELILAALYIIPAGLLINNLKKWLFSLPLQFALYALTLWLIGENANSIGRFLLHLLIAQVVGVAIGLLVRKHRARK